MQTIEQMIQESESALRNVFRQCDEIAYKNQAKVLEAFQKNKIALAAFYAFKRVWIR